MSPSQFRRSYLIVHRTGPADTDTVAQLFVDAAEQLRCLGPVTVHHIDMDIGDSARAPEVYLTVYYDRTERRQEHR